MGRRRSVALNRFKDGERCSVGDHYVDSACNNLNAACLKEAAIFTPGITADEVTPMIFNDAAITKLKAVHGLLATEARDQHYDLQPRAVGILFVRTEDRPAAAKAYFEWHADRAGPLKAMVDEIAALHIKWGAVKHLLRWFNRNATIGAVRANWPSVLQLCPDAPSLKELQHAPTRYTNPQELSALLPLIRATATTVASMAMIPGEAQPRTLGSVWLSLPERTVDYEGTTIKLDQQTFFL